MTLTEKALEYHKSGFNCAQSVLASLGDYTGLDEKTALAVSGGFGGGMRCGEMCGSVSGALMAIGLCCRFNEAENKDAKDKIALLTKDFNGRFKERFGYLRCKDLKRKKISCDELIAAAAEIAEEIIKNI